MLALCSSICVRTMFLLSYYSGDVCLCLGVMYMFFVCLCVYIYIHTHICICIYIYEWQAQIIKQKQCVLHCPIKWANDIYIYIMLEGFVLCWLAAWYLKAASFCFHLWHECFALQCIAEAILFVSVCVVCSLSDCSLVNVSPFWFCFAL